MVTVNLKSNKMFAEECEAEKYDDWNCRARLNEYETVNMMRIRDAIFPEYNLEAHNFIRRLDENLEKYEVGNLESFSRMVCKVAEKLTGVEITPVFQ